MLGHQFPKSLHVVGKAQSNLELLSSLENHEFRNGVQYHWENLDMVLIDAICCSPVLNRSLRGTNSRRFDLHYQVDGGHVSQEHGTGMFVIAV